MSDDLTARINEALDGTTAGPWFVRPFNDDRVVSFIDEFGATDDICDVNASYVNNHEADAALIAAAPSLLAEARDEINRLREGIERHRDRHRDSPAIRVLDRGLWALLDAPSTASPVRDGTNTERDEP